MNKADGLQRIPRMKAMEFQFDRQITPILRVKPGETFLVETEDAYGGLIRTHDRLPIPEHVPGLRPGTLWGNPMAGPIFVEGARRGDLIAIRIEKIVVDAQGVTCIEPGLGPLQDSNRWSECRGPYTHIIRHLAGPSGTTRDGKGVFTDRVVWDLKPFIGTIGVAPELEIASSVTGQGPWGGNIDCRDIKERSKLYLNSYHDGGLLFVGDVHGSQADTEFYGVADETRAELTLTCEVIENKWIPNPRLEKEDSIITLCSSRPLEDAVTGAMLDMMEWMVTEYGIGQREAYMHLTVNPDVRVHVYQMVNTPRMAFTAGVEIPKTYLS